MLCLAAELDLKSAALKKEAYSHFTAAIAGVPVPKLWDLWEAAFGGSDSEEDIEEDDLGIPLPAKRPRSEPSSMATLSTNPEPTIPRATISATPPWSTPLNATQCYASGKPTPVQY